MSAPILLPRMYLAGPIEKNCWRHAVVPGLRGATWDDSFIVTDDFVYTGPFFRGCDHGCSHGSATHGMAPGCGEFSSTTRELRALCLSRVGCSDVVFAYINAPECVGTIVELQHALHLGKHVDIAYCPKMTKTAAEYRFLNCRARRVDANVSPADLPQLVRSSARATAIGLGSRVRP